MKKYIIISFSVFLIIIFSIPLVIGVLYKSQYNTLVDSVGASTQGQMQSKVLDYRLGWLRSTIRTETTLSNFNKGDKLVFDQTEHVSHGPFVYDPIKKRFSMNFTATTAQGVVFLVTQKGAKTQLTSFTENAVMNFDKTMLSNFTIGKASINTLQWNGMRGSYKGQIHKGMLRHESFSFTSGALSISDPTATDTNAPASIQVESASINCNASNPAVSSIDACSFVMPLTTIKFNDQSTVVIHALAIKNNATLKENNYSSLFTLTINKIDAPQFAIPNINTVNFNVSTKNLNLSTLKNAATDAEMLQNMPMRADFLNAATTINTSLTAQSTFGYLKINVAGNWKTMPRKTITNIDELQKFTHIDATLQINIALAKKIAALIAPLIPQEEIAALREKAGMRQLENATNPDNKDLFDKEIALLVQKNQLDLPSAISIMNAQENHMAADDFKALINALPISNEDKAKLLEKWRKLHPGEQPVAGTF